MNMKPSLLLEIRLKYLRSLALFLEQQIAFKITNLNVLAMQEPTI